MNTSVPRAIVVGGSKGIGYACARKLATAGWSVESVARGPLWSDVPAGALWSHRQIDLATEIPVEEWRRFLSGSTGPVALVQCLGGTLGIRSIDAPADDWKAVMNLNFHLPVRIHQAFCELLREAHTAAIVHLGSSAAIHGRASTPYACAKAALHRFIASSGSGQETRDVLVCGVAPAVVSGYGNNWDRCRVDKPDVWIETAKRQPLGQFQTPDTIAELIYWIVGQRPLHIAGCILNLDPLTA